MQVKQVFSTYSRKEDGNLGRLSTAPSAEHNWHWSRKVANKDQHAPIAGSCSWETQSQESWS
jgi:hypothetical protein